MKQIWLFGVFGLGCARPAPAPQDPPHDAAVAVTSEPLAVDAGVVKVAKIEEPKTIDFDGDDDPEDPGTGTIPEGGHWEKVGTPPLALTRICDLTPFDGSLYAAHANQPLGTDGATITRFDPKNEKRPFTVAYDWNRPGEPTKGGGAGQGFLRVHAFDKRLFVTDADPPYGGLQLVDWGTEGYVFVSDDRGKFAPPRAPHFRPPGPPELRDGEPARAGAGVLPRAYHVIDVIKYRGSYFASTGSVPPKEQAWRGPSPGALHRANADGSRWTYEVDYPFPWQNGVWRLTYLVRFHDRLYAGIQDFDGKDPNDFLYFAPEDASNLKHEDMHPVRVTKSGASGTLRWWVDTHASPHRLYWLAWTHEGIVIRVTTDGDNWSVVELPAEAGRPTDITRYRDAVVVLAENGLYRLDGSRIAETPSGAGSVRDKKSPFTISDFMCTAPLAVLDNELYAGGQRGGTLYRLAF